MNKLIILFITSCFPLIANAESTECLLTETKSYLFTGETVTKYSYTHQCSYRERGYKLLLRTPFNSIENVSPSILNKVFEIVESKIDANKRVADVEIYIKTNNEPWYSIRIRDPISWNASSFDTYRLIRDPNGLKVVFEDPLRELVEDKVEKQLPQLLNSWLKENPLLYADNPCSEDSGDPGDNQEVVCGPDTNVWKQRESPLTITSTHDLYAYVNGNIFENPNQLRFKVLSGAMMPDDYSIQCHYEGIMHLDTATFELDPESLNRCWGDSDKK